MVGITETLNKIMNEGRKSHYDFYYFWVLCLGMLHSIYLGDLISFGSSKCNVKV